MTIPSPLATVAGGGSSLELWIRLAPAQTPVLRCFPSINRGGTGASAGFVWILDWPEMLEQMGVGGGR